MKPLHFNVTLLLIGISTALLGLSILLLGPHKHIALTTDFYLISDVLPAQVFNSIAAFAFMSTAVLAFLSIKQANFRAILGYVLIVISIVPLGSLFSDSM